MITPPIKFHGGKHYMARHLHQIASPCKFHPTACPTGWLHRVIPFAGGLGEFWSWDHEGVSEVINDLDRHLTCFWRVLQHDQWFSEFVRRAQAIPFSAIEFAEADDDTPDQSVVDRALNFFIRVRQSMAGRMDSFAPLSRNRTRRGMNEQASAWLTAVEGLPQVHERLKSVVILNDDALKVIKQQDGPHTLFYLDPPYLPDTRTSPDVYAHEMSRFQHARLLVVLSLLKGLFMLSGYDNELYQLAERKYGWRRHTFVLPNNAASGDNKRRMQEIVWTNF